MMAGDVRTARSRIFTPARTARLPIAAGEKVAGSDLLVIATLIGSVFSGDSRSSPLERRDRVHPDRTTRRRITDVAMIDGAIGFRATARVRAVNAKQTSDWSEHFSFLTKRSANTL